MDGSLSCTGSVSKTWYSRKMSLQQCPFVSKRQVYTDLLMLFRGKLVSICQIRHWLASIPPLTNTLCAVVLRLAFISALPPPSLSFPKGSATYLSYVNSLAAPLPVPGCVYVPVYLWQKGSPQGRFLEAKGPTRADILSCSWRPSLDTRKRYKSLTPTQFLLILTCVDIPSAAPILASPLSNDRVSGRVLQETTPHQTTNQAFWEAQPKPCDHMQCNQSSPFTFVGGLGLAAPFTFHLYE